MIARRTGFTGADLHNLMNESAIVVVRCEIKEISKNVVILFQSYRLQGSQKCNFGFNVLVVTSLVEVYEKMGEWVFVTRSDNMIPCEELFALILLYIMSERMKIMHVLLSG